jgi:hypothetical protein
MTFMLGLSGTTKIISRRDASEVCMCPSKKREQGMPGARCTRDLMCKIARKKTHMSIQVQSETLRHSPRNGFTAYAALSPATNSSCHRHRRIEGFVAPGWADQTSADLTPATGARTTQFCRTQTPTQKVSTGLVPVRRSFSEGGFGAVVLREEYRSRDKPALRY